MKSWSVGIEPLALDIGSIGATMADTLIWSETESVMDIEYGIDSTLYETSTISVFYAYDILSMIMASPKIGIESCPEITDVDRSCRRRS
jgi:hypothetical protein